MGMKYQNEHRALGLCVNCSKLAMRGNKYCTYCYQKHRKSDMDYYWRNKEARDMSREARYERLKEEGKCVTCGVRLLEDWGVHCVNCRHDAVMNMGVLYEITNL